MSLSILMENTGEVNYEHIQETLDYQCDSTNVQSSRVKGNKYKVLKIYRYSKRLIILLFILFLYYLPRYVCRSKRQ